MLLKATNTVHFANLTAPNCVPNTSHSFMSVAWAEHQNKSDRVFGPFRYKPRAASEPLTPVVLPSHIALPLCPRSPSSAVAGSAGKVLLACDSRPSSPALLAAAAAGVQALGAVAIDCGQLTTPQLHWQLRRLNQGLPWALEDYFTTLAGAYRQLVKGTEPLGQVGPVVLS